MIGSALVAIGMLLPQGVVGQPAQVVMPKPDLVIASASVAPDRIERGGTTQLTVSVRNMGSLGSAAAQVGVTVRRSAGGPAVYSHNFPLAATAAGATTNLTLTVPFAESVATGGYTIDIVADATGRVIERDESNNASIPLTVAVVEPGPPPGRVVAVRPDVSVDLVVRRVRFTRSSANAGETVNVLFDVANEGNAAVTGSTAAVRLSTAPNVDAGVAAVGLLHPAGSEPVSIPVTLPNVTRVTTLRATAIADSPGVFAEPNEENNRGTATLEVLPPPRANLYIDNFTVNPGSVARGGSVHVHFQLVNGGDLDATAMSTHYYLSSSPTGEPRIPLEDLGISGLRAQRNMTYDFDVVIPAGTTPGARYFCVRADGANQVVESSEGDNMSALPITVL